MLKRVQNNFQFVFSKKDTVERTCRIKTNGLYTETNDLYVRCE